MPHLESCVRWRHRHKLHRGLIGIAASVVVAVSACRSTATSRAPTSSVGVMEQATNGLVLPPLVLDDTLRPALLAAGLAALGDALKESRDTAAVCVAFAGPGRTAFGPDTNDLRVLARSSAEPHDPRRFVSVADCPRTYGSMIATIDSPDRSVATVPRSHADPHTLGIELPEHWVPKPDERSITVMVRVGQGTSGSEYLCRVRPATARAATAIGQEPGALAAAATCRVLRRYVS